MKRERAGVSIKATVIILAMLIGVIACPLQIIYCVAFSGKQVSKHEIEIGKPTAIALSQDMNPIRFIASIDYESPRRVSMGGESTVFDSTLSYSNVEVWSEQFDVNVDDDDDDNSGSGINISFGSGVNLSTNTSNVRSFEVENDGEYEFLVSNTRTKELKVHAIRVKVRQNVQTVNVPIAVAGGLMMVLAMVIGFVTLMMTGSKKLPT